MKTVKNILYFLSVFIVIIYIFFIKDLEFIKVEIWIFGLLVLISIISIELYAYLNEKKNN